MKKIMEAWDKGCAWLCSFGADKYLHLIVGLAFAVVVAVVMRATTPGCYVSAYAFMGVVGAVVLMIIKELLDFFRGERFDGVDALFGVIGGVVGALMWMI